MTVILLAMALLGTAVLIYGMVADSTVLSVLGFVVAMPMTLALLINIGMHFMAPRRSPPE